MNTGFLSGLIAAPFTAFNAANTMRVDVVPDLARLLAADRVSGVFAGGTTGEFASLAVDERESLHRAWIDAAKLNGLRCLVHIGATSVEECRRLAAHASAHGADAISAVAPYYYPPTSVEDLIRFYEPVVEAAPDIPFFYYHIPAFTGVSLSPVEFARAARNRLPSLKGIKFSDLNAIEFQLLVEEFGAELEILWGVDEALLTGVTLGAHGAVGSTYNYMAPHHLGMLALLSAGEIEKAQAYQRRTAQLVAALGKTGGLAANKALMAIARLECGPCRPPLKLIDASQRETIQRAFTGLRLHETKE